MAGRSAGGGRALKEEPGGTACADDCPCGVRVGAVAAVYVSGADDAGFCSFVGIVASRADRPAHMQKIVPGRGTGRAVLGILAGAGEAAGVALGAEEEGGVGVEELRTRGHAGAVADESVRPTGAVCALTPSQHQIFSAGAHAAIIYHICQGVGSYSWAACDAISENRLVQVHLASVGRCSARCTVSCYI